MEKLFKWLLIIILSLISSLCIGFLFAALASFRIDTETIFFGVFLIFFGGVASLLSFPVFIYLIFKLLKNSPSNN